MCEKTNADVTFNLSQREVDRVIDRLKTNKADEPRIVAASTAKLPRQELLLELWTEALDRLSANDTDVAITTAGTLLEAICKMALRETKNPYPEGADLPKLYCLASAPLGLSAGPQTTKAVKSMLGATAVFVAAVAELRKQVDDTQEGVEGRVSMPHFQAELAVNVSGALAQSLMNAIEHYIAASHRVELSAGPF